MSWQEVKKAVNSDIPVPLNHLLWLQDYKVYGESSYVWNDKKKLHELYKSEAVNDKATYSEAFLWLNDNVDGHMRSTLANFAPFQEKEIYAKEYIKDLLSEEVLDAGVWDKIYDEGFVDFFLMSKLYEKNAINAVNTILMMRDHMSDKMFNYIKTLAAFKSSFTDEKLKVTENYPCTINKSVDGPMFILSSYMSVTHYNNYSYRGTSYYTDENNVEHTLVPGQTAQTGVSPRSENPYVFAKSFRSTAINTGYTTPNNSVVFYDLTGIIDL